MTTPDPTPPSSPQSTGDEKKTAEKGKVADISSAAKTNAPRRSVFYFLFSPQTRVGRVMRPVLRWLGAITGLFALGMLSTYLLLYQPAQSDLNAAQQRAASMQATLTVAQKDLQAARAHEASLQDAISQSQVNLKLRAAENELLNALSAIQQARVSLVGKDGAAAKTAIELAQASLARALPQIASIDTARADVLKTRLDLAAKELAADPTAAQTDLEKLANDLTEIQQKLLSDQ